MTNAERFALCSESREQDQRSLILFAMVWCWAAPRNSAKAVPPVPVSVVEPARPGEA